MPRTPERDKEVSQFKHPETELGLYYIQAGGQPMTGVQILKDVADKDTTDKAPRAWLARMSLMTGQDDKAVEHFERLLSIEEDPRERWAIQTQLLSLYQKLSDSVRVEQIQERMQEELARSLGADHADIDAEHAPH